MTPKSLPVEVYLQWLERTKSKDHLQVRSLVANMTRFKQNMHASASLHHRVWICEGSLKKFSYDRMIQSVHQCPLQIL